MENILECIVKCEINWVGERWNYCEIGKREKEARCAWKLEVEIVRALGLELNGIK
jgi:hypothetical protein